MSTTPRTRAGWTAGLLLTGVLAGGLVGGALPALAQDASPSPSTGAPTLVLPDDDQAPGGRDCPEHDGGGAAGDGGAADGTGAATPTPSTSAAV